MTVSSTKACQNCGTTILGKWAKKFCSHRCYGAFKLAKRVRDGEARCSRCRLWKPVTEFVRGKYGGVHSHCKLCNADWHVPPEKRVKPYREAGSVTPEQKAANKREANQRQHHARRAAGKAPTRDQLDRIYCDQGACCAYCGDALPESPHLDHKLPVSRGGTNDLCNIHFTCPRCNMRKGAMTHEEFLVSKRRPVRRNYGA